MLLVDGDEEPKYIASYAEALGQGAEEEKVKPALTEITDNEPTPFDDVQSETDDDWRNELAAELTDSDEQEEPVEAEENDASEQDEPSEEESEKPKNKSKSTPKKPEQGIKDRKRKEKPQPTLFDLMDTQEQSAEEALIERQLKYGSGVEYGKFRIFDKYNENPSAKTFAEFLKDEYGWGGHGGWSGDDEMHDSKGITMSVRGNKGETIIKVSLKWPEVAVRIADLIDDDNYLSEQEKKEYVEYKVEQNRKREQRAEEERQKNEFIGKVIFAAPVDRKQRILDEYAKTTKLSDLAGFLKNEYGTTEETNAVYSATYNEMGVWIFKSGEENDYQKRIYLNWEEFADKVCNLIENDRYIEQPEVQKAEPPRDLDAEEDEDWDKLIDAGILKPVYPIQFNRFKKLSADDKAYFERYSQRDIIEPTNSLWGEVQNCTVIANGIYEVDTEGHGGVMIKSELAQRVLSLEALSIGYRDGGYLCYEEDCDAQIPLRELYDKGILRQSAAIRLFNNGVQIHKLGKDDTETEVGYLSDIEENALYGVEKSDWKNYIESENGLAYLATRSQFARASKAVTSKELDSVDERFTGDFIETNYMERSDLDKYLADKPKIEAEAMKSYTSQLLDEFSGRIWRDELKYYGWDEITLKNSIVNHIENEELKAEAKRITDIPFNAEKELMTILGGMTEEEIEDMDLPAFDDELTVLEKQPAYLVHESRAIQNYLDGLLLLRNDTTGSNWYVINDTYAKNKDGNYLEKDDIHLCTSEVPTGQVSIKYICSTKAKPKCIRCLRMSLKRRQNWSANGTSW